MKKVIFIISFLLTVSIIVGIAWTAHRYYSPSEYRMTYPVSHTNDTLCIAYIGDSWAFLHQKHQCMIPFIINNKSKRFSAIYSYGLCGRTSKEIYEALFNDEDLKRLLLERSYNYVVISAGINDINKKMSTKYYQESMDCIIRFFLSNNVHPIILEIPDFDVYKIYRWQGLDRKILRKLSMEINKVPLDCKQMYRDALDNLIHDKGYQNKVSIISYLTWNNDYTNDLNHLYMKDGVHLNDYGNAVLDSVIAKEIIKLENYDHRN